jgi:cyanophycinase-like exopeptidase
MPKPIYLFADSQLLFWQQDGQPFLRTIGPHLSTPPAGGTLKAAYIGASNGDVAEFYEIFRAAMAGIGIHDCRAIRAGFELDDAAFLETADLILLAGGDVAHGWQAFVASGMQAAIVRRYEAGALLIGTSAGAVQLGRYGFGENGGTPPATTTTATTITTFTTFGLVPFVIDAHDEANGWQRLQTVLQQVGDGSRGIGIATGGGLLVWPDGRWQALRHDVFCCPP